MAEPHPAGIESLSPAPEEDLLGGASAGWGQPSNDEINDQLFGQRPEPYLPPHPNQTRDEARARERAELEARYPNHLIPSAEIVAAFREDHAQRVAWLRIRGVNLQLDVLSPGEGRSDNDSYIRQVEKYGAQVDVPSVVHRGEPSELTGVIAKIRENPRSKGYLLLSGDDDHQLRAAAGGDRPDPKDLDGAGVLTSADRRVRVATTAQSIRVYAERILGVNLGHLKRRGIVTAGRGNVGGPFVDRVLADDGIAPDVALDTTDQVVNNAAHLQGVPVRVLFSMARGYHVIDARTITPPKPDAHPYSGITLIIDAGNAKDPNSSAWGGSVDPATLAGTHVFATPFRGGLGPLTVALLYERLIQNAEREVAEQTARERYEQSIIGRVHHHLGALATRVKGLLTRKPEATGENAPDDISELADEENELANA